MFLVWTSNHHSIQKLTAQINTILLWQQFGHIRFGKVCVFPRKPETKESEGWKVPVRRWHKVGEGDGSSSHLRRRKQVQLLTARQPAAPACPPLLRRMKASLMTKPCPDSHDLCLALVLASSGHLNQQSPHGSRLAGGATETTNSMDSWMQTHTETTPSWWKTQKNKHTYQRTLLATTQPHSSLPPPSGSTWGYPQPRSEGGVPPSGALPHSPLSAAPSTRLEAYLRRAAIGAPDLLLILLVIYLPKY